MTVAFTAVRRAMQTHCAPLHLRAQFASATKRDVHLVLDHVIANTLKDLIAATP